MRGVFSRRASILIVALAVALRLGVGAAGADAPGRRLRDVPGIGGASAGAPRARQRVHLHAGLRAAGRRRAGAGRRPAGREDARRRRGRPGRVGGLRDRGPSLGPRHGDRRRLADCRLAGRNRGCQRDRHRHAGSGAAGRGGRGAGAARGARAALARGDRLRRDAGAGGLRARGRAAAGAARVSLLGGGSADARRAQGRSRAHRARLRRRRGGAAAVGHPQPAALRRALHHRQSRRPHRAGRRQPRHRRRLLALAEPDVLAGHRLSPVRSEAARRRSRGLRAGEILGAVRTGVRDRAGRGQGRPAADQRAPAALLAALSRERARAIRRARSSIATAPASSGWSTASGTCCRRRRSRGWWSRRRGASGARWRCCRSRSR